MEAGERKSLGRHFLAVGGWKCSNKAVMALAQAKD
jgi:hypothetical protein